MRGNVLVIEDNFLNMKLFCDLLSGSGYAPIAATSGQEGIALANRQIPDLIIVDLQLPDRSGLDVILAIKEAMRFTAVPVLATSAFRLRADEQWLCEHRCDAFFAKPISAKAFLAEVSRLLIQPVTADRTRRAPADLTRELVPNGPGFE